MKSLSLLILFIFNFTVINPSNASSFVSGDLTYSCLGGNTYNITFAYYCDCSGSPPPLHQQIYFDCSSDTTNNFSTNLIQIPGTGIEVTPNCSCDSTTCIGGTAFGVREYVYQAQVTLVDSNYWKMHLSGCCRNALTTTTGDTTNTWYIEAIINNYLAPCNSGPSFSNKPIAIVCNNYSYCFNHGTIDPDGDSLVYYFCTPKKDSTNTISYNSPWSATNFLTSSASSITIDSITGDICFTPSVELSSITGVKIEEWRTTNGLPKLIGTTFRDIQFRVRSCKNEIPVLSGMDTLNTHQYSINDTTYNKSWNAGESIDFDINGFDADTATPGCYIHPEEFLIYWNNGIQAAVFTPHYNNSDSAYAHFHWAPTYADISNTPHCFIATIQDNACPYYGSQSYTYCITIKPNVGIKKHVFNTSINIFPNPSSGIFKINFTTKSVTSYQIHIFNTEGKEVYMQNWERSTLGNDHKIDLSHLSNGEYYIVINQNNTRLKSAIIIKK